MRKTVLTLAISGVLLHVSTARAQHEMPGSGGVALRSSCAAQMNNLPVDVDLPYSFGWPQVVTAPSFASGEQSCLDFTWVRKFFYYQNLIDPEFGGPAITNSGWDCNHSSVEYGVYRRVGSTWSYVGGGLMYGALKNGQCTYSVSNFPQQPGTDTVFPLNVCGNPGFPCWTEIRVGIRTWSHNDRALGHPGNQCSGTSCWWPSKILWYSY